ncbi:hypothetical protein ACLI09_16510 [Flavobacterium sp. RHBU_24]|uniref:hypothetical protein n=1 Tax=Flavobacterium sp. RHBU_24 TaxID=3391185 RepID=UPI003984D83B
MKTLSLLFLISISICSYSCSLGFNRNEKIVGKYHIIAMDSYAETCLAYKVGHVDYVGLVSAEVLAYCKNNHHIFVKQNPYGKRDDSPVNYYIVPIVNDTITVYPEERIIGPLKERAFNREISKLKVRDLEFKEVD